MSPAPPPPLSNLSRAVMNAVKAEMALREITGNALATTIGRSASYLSKRLNGEIAFDLTDIDRIAGAFDLEASVFIRHALDDQTERDRRAAAYAPQRVTPTRPTASATTPRVAPAMASVTKFHDRHALTPAEEAEIMRLTLEDQFAASDPEDNDDTDQYEGA